MALGLLAATPRPSARGQEAEHPPAIDADAAIEKRITDLEKTIGQHVEAGRIAEAIPPARERLDLLIRLRGKGHWQTGDARRDAETYEHLAARPREVQDRFAQARRAIARGDQLNGEGQSARASGPFQDALAIFQEILPEGHPDIAESYDHLGEALQDQGKYAEAEAMHRRALAIRLKALPEGHALIVAACANLADILDREGKTDEAIRAWRSAAAAHELARTFAPRGLEPAIRIGSPLPRLAAALARAGRPRDAWASWERGLARGVTDEVTRRVARPLTADERDREAELLGRGQTAEERINKLLSARALTADQEKALDDLRQQASEVRRELLELDRQFEDRYGALASRPATLEEAREAIPEGTVLLGWIDTKTDHWACLLGHSGDPAWVRLAGSGKDGAWTREDDGISQGLRSELDLETTKGEAGAMAESLARQRLDPLKGHLAGVRRLIVVNSPGIAGVPVEVLMAARPDPAWDAISVSYTPSASMFAYLAGQIVPRDRPATLLVVADPAYPRPEDDAPAPEAPASGLGVARVVSNGNADLNGIREGDVLLAYAGMVLKRPGDLKPIAPDGGPKQIPVKYWREGIAREAELAAGPLGVAIDPRPAPEFVRAGRESRRVLLGMRGGSHARLPGTRREVEALKGLFADGRATTILGPQACEATVQGLARSGQLKGYRYLHFATHGQSDPRFAYRTALILAPDPDTGADPTATETDGTITAEQIARTWQLDADLVVLSACESGLGRADAGEGYLGFAQPLFARGARSLVLSQWKVDDDATVLLMARFYGNWK